MEKEENCSDFNGYKKTKDYGSDFSPCEQMIIFICIIVIIGTCVYSFNRTCYVEDNILYNNEVKLTIAEKAIVKPHQGSSSYKVGSGRGSSIQSNATFSPRTYYVYLKTNLDDGYYYSIFVSEEEYNNYRLGDEYLESRESPQFVMGNLVEKSRVYSYMNQLEEEHILQEWKH